jgi:RNA polymerase sigma-70 factor (ECF subfamily)
VREDTLERELLAETLSEAWFARGRFRDLEGSGAGPWLVGIANNLVRRTYRNRAIDKRARSRLGLPAEPSDAYAELLDRMAADQLMGSLGGRIDELPIEQREALELRVVDELEYSEIASRLAITSEGARTRVFRALNALRAHVERSES